MTTTFFSTRRILASAILLIGSIVTGLGQTQEEIVRGQNFFNAGSDLLETGKFPEAVQKLSEAISILPAWHLPYLNRGIAHLSLSKLTEAEADADKALSLIQPGTKSGDLHAGTAHQVKGTVRQQQGDYKAALEQFLLSVERVPTNAKFHNSLGTAFRLLDRYEDALASYSKAIDLDPKFAAFYVNRAGIFERLKNIEGALKDLDEALRLDKNDSTAYYTRGTIRMRTKQGAAALADFDEAIRLDPRKAGYHHGRGLQNYSDKQYEAALKDLSAAISLDPKNSSFYSDRAVVHNASRNPKAAIEDIRRAVSLETESSALRYNLSYYLYQDAQFAQSIDAATQAISRSPNWRAPYILRSNAYIKLGMQAKAKIDREKAASIRVDEKPVKDKYFIFSLDVLPAEETKP
jgi:tetratricopeptide (TPR) repeat protein